MANERIEVDLVLDEGQTKKAFIRFEDQARVSGQKAGDELQGGFNSGVSNLASGLRTQLLGLGAAFAGLAGISKVFGDLNQLETAFAEIKTIIPDVSQANEELRQSFINLSGEFGTSATDQAKSFYSIVSAGITDTTLAQEALTAANKLAIGGLTDTQTAIDIVTSSINAYGAEALSAETASDVLFGAVRLGKTTVEELSGSLGQILPTASSLKVGFEDVAAATAALTTRGVSTSAAVTQLNAVLTAVLKNQQVAVKLGPDVAKSFSLQALQTKGLTGFLRDLNTSLGGSEQALVKLLGSAEAARGVLALSGDGFQTLGNNVDALKNSAGAAEAAFQTISQTTQAQTDQLFSKLGAIFARIAGSSSGLVFDIVSNLNAALGNVLTNFDAIANSFASIAQKIVVAFLTLTVGPRIFSGLSSGLGGILNQFSLLPTRIGLAGIQLKSFGLSLRNISFAGAVNGLKNFRLGLKLTGVGLRALRVAINLTKAAATLGLAFAFDFLVEKAIELKDSFGGIGNTLRFLSLTAQRTFNNIILSVIGFIRQAEKLPLIGDKIKGSLGGTFDQIEFNAAQSLQAIGVEFDQLADKVAKETTTVAFAAPTAPTLPGPDAGGTVSFPPINQELLDSNRAKVEAALASETSATKKARDQQVNISELAFKRITSLFNRESFNIGVSQAQLEKTATESFNRIGAAATEGFARSFASIGEAIVKGENAFEAFGSAILGVLGDVAIQAGTMYTLLGIASFNPAQVAAGIALSVLGGVLKAVAGGGSSSPGVSAPGGGLTSNPIDGNTSPIDADQAIGSQVSVNIQGDVFDSSETGLRIASILKEEGFNNSVITA